MRSDVRVLPQPVRAPPAHPRSPRAALPPGPARGRLSAVPGRLLPAAPPCPPPHPPRGTESCARKLLPALSSRLAPSPPVLLLLPAAAAGLDPYLTTAAEEEDEDAAGAAGGGAVVLRWPWGAAGVPDADDDDAAALARPGPGGKDPCAWNCGGGGGSLLLMETVACGAKGGGGGRTCGSSTRVGRS